MQASAAGILATAAKRRRIEQQQVVAATDTASSQDTLNYVACGEEEAAIDAASKVVEEGE